tara:strand:+ start:108 stop:467 length:360 start_codon:yes stop_codon:yes gene_type:complete
MEIIEIYSSKTGFTKEGEKIVSKILKNKISRNDLKKGDKVMLYDGTVKAEILNNQRGVRRFMKVEQFGRPGSYDYGDTYVHEIHHIYEHLGKEGYWEIEYTPKQQKEIDLIQSALDRRR